MIGLKLLVSLCFIFICEVVNNNIHVHGGDVSSHHHQKSKNGFVLLQKGKMFHVHGSESKVCVRTYENNISLISLIYNNCVVDYLINDYSSDCSNPNSQAAEVVVPYFSYCSLLYEPVNPNLLLYNKNFVQASLVVDDLDMD